MPCAAKALNVYDFPGNVRELKHMMERAVFTCSNAQVFASDLALNSTPHSALQSMNTATVSAPENHDLTLMKLLSKHSLKDWNFMVVTYQKRRRAWDYRAVRGIAKWTNMSRR